MKLTVSKYPTESVGKCPKDELFSSIVVEFHVRWDP